MSVSLEQKAAAVKTLGSIGGVHVVAAHLVADVEALADVWDDPSDFLMAVASTKNAIELVVRGQVTVADLDYQLQGWSAYHYQHARLQGAKADMRIVFREVEGGMQLLAFGHRKPPESVYFAAKERL